MLYLLTEASPRCTHRLRGGENRTKMPHSANPRRTKTWKQRIIEDELRFPPPLTGMLPPAVAAFAVASPIVAIAIPILAPSAPPEAPWGEAAAATAAATAAILSRRALARSRLAVRQIHTLVLAGTTYGIAAALTLSGLIHHS